MLTCLRHSHSGNKKTVGANVLIKYKVCPDNKSDVFVRNIYVRRYLRAQMEIWIWISFKLTL